MSKFVLQLTRMPSNSSPPVSFKRVVDFLEQPSENLNFLLAKNFLSISKIFKIKNLKFHLCHSQNYNFKPFQQQDPKGSVFKSNTQRQGANQWINRTLIRLRVEMSSLSLSCSHVFAGRISACYPFR